LQQTLLSPALSPTPTIESHKKFVAITRVASISTRNKNKAAHAFGITATRKRKLRCGDKNNINTLEWAATQRSRTYDQRGRKGVGARQRAGDVGACLLLPATPTALLLWFIYQRQASRVNATNGMRGVRDAGGGKVWKPWASNNMQFQQLRSTY